MADKIRVLIVDDIPETRENVRKLLQFEPDLEVVAHAATGDEAINMAEQYRPDIVLMDINMPDADGIAASQTITKNVPGTQVIIMSVQSEADYLRRAMLAGARDFLMKPFSGDELVGAIRDVHATRPVASSPVISHHISYGDSPDQSRRAFRAGKIVTVFSPKGGNGCTTIAVNIAVTLAEEGHNTLLLDGCLQFGGVDVMLNLRSMTSIIDLIERSGELDQELISSVVITHNSGLKVLLAPPRPEMAELVSAEDMRALLEQLRHMFDYVILDTSSGLNDVNIAMLDASDRIILVTQQNLPSLKNVSRFFDLSEDLEYEQGKVILVVNHASKKLNITVKDIEETLKWPAAAVIPEEPAAYSAADQGRPLVSEVWRRRPGSRALTRFTGQLIRDLGRNEKPEKIAEAEASTRLGRLLGR